MEDNINYASDNEDDDDERLPILIRNYRPSFIGRIRTSENIDRLEWLLIIVSITIIAIGLGFTIFRMATINPGSDQFVFAILVLVNLGFSFYYILHGILQEQPFEILTYIFTTLIIAVLVTINFATSTGEKDVVRMTRFIVTVVLSIPNVALASKIGWNFWKSGPFVFKTVGGDMFLQKICRTYLFGLSLLIFDAQIMISCCLLLIQHGISGMTNEEIVLFITGILFTGIWGWVGYTGMRKEHIKITYLFATISIVQPLYVLYLFVQCLEQIEKPYSIRTNSAIFGGIILLLVHFTFIAVLFLIGTNYGKGLKKAIYGVDSSVGTLTSVDLNNHQNEEDYDAIIPAD